MSAAARGAAGYRYMRDRNAGRRDPKPLQPQAGEVEAFIRLLVSKGVTEERASELAAEQSAKTFNRARSGARR